MAKTTVKECAVDCSVVCKWELPGEPLADKATDMLEDWRHSAIQVVAPTVLLPEIASAFLRAARRGRLPLPNAVASVRNLAALPFVLCDITPLFERTMELAWQRDQGLFDCLYVALAEAHGVELWTADERLFNALSASLPFVRWIGDYQRVIIRA